MESRKRGLRRGGGQEKRPAGSAEVDFFWPCGRRFRAGRKGGEGREGRVRQRVSCWLVVSSCGEEKGGGGLGGTHYNK